MRVSISYTRIPLPPKTMGFLNCVCLWKALPPLQLRLCLNELKHFNWFYSILTLILTQIPSWAYIKKKKKNSVRYHAILLQNGFCLPAIYGSLIQQEIKLRLTGEVAIFKRIWRNTIFQEFHHFWFIIHFNVFRKWISQFHTYAEWDRYSIRFEIRRKIYMLWLMSLSPLSQCCDFNPSFLTHVIVI